MKEWNKAELERYISEQIEENLNLDYKGAASLAKSDGKKAEISKDVSAFANSGGGTIIYGLLEFQDKERSHLPEKLDPVDRTFFSKETLEQIINSNISPRVSGILITAVQLDATNGVGYVVEIPKSTTAHQAADKRYYKRFNFLSIAMEDYEVRDVMNRNILTNVKIGFRFAHGQKYFEQFAKSSAYRFEFEVIAINEGTKVCNYIDCYIGGNDKVFALVETNHKLNSNKKFEIGYDNEIEHTAEFEGNSFTLNYQRIPIGPSTTRTLGRFIINSDFFVQNLSLNVAISTDDNIVVERIEAKDLNVVFE